MNGNSGRESTRAEQDKTRERENERRKERNEREKKMQQIFSECVCAHAAVLYLCVCRHCTDRDINFTEEREHTHACKRVNERERE